MNLIILPILIPLIFIIIFLVMPGKSKWNGIFGIGGSLLLFVISIIIFITVAKEDILILQSGGWSSPFGISIVVDIFSSIMLLMSGLIGFTVAVYSYYQLDRARLENRFFLFYMAVLMGVNGAFITGDIFNLYVWFEVMIIASFILITLGGERAQLKGAIKYVTMNLVSSLFFLAGIGLLYGKTGTLNIADLAQILRSADEAVLINTSAMLFFIAFGIKSAIFPLFFWLPASYHTPPVSITAFFAGLLTKVGVYSMIRFFTMFFIEDIPFWQVLLLTIAGFTMVVGVLTAASQYEMRKILSFHIISQVGYMVLGLGLFTVAGVAGAIFYIVHNIVSKTATFLSAGMVHRLTGSYELKSIGGLYKKYPFLSLLFLIPAMSLAGIPPLSGFVGKLYLIIAGFEAEKWLITAIAIVVSLLTLFSMVKIWNEVFWKPSPGSDENIVKKESVSAGMVIPLVILAVLTILLGVFGGYFIEISTRAAEQMLYPDGYINEVLNK
jgi:multicomponent Na+:H+ antiporter subunit D